MFSVKVHNKYGETLVAACDIEILGKKFSEGDLELMVSGEFYGGQEASFEEILCLAQDSSIANFSGNNIVGQAIAAGIVDEEYVINIGGVKHAQIIELS
ncbi:MAG: DUF424 family protein [Candidatus Altiarchaeota archaeon]